MSEQTVSGPTAMARNLNDYRYPSCYQTHFKASELDVYCRSRSKSCTDKMRPLPQSLSRDEGGCSVLALTMQVSLVCMLVHPKQRSLVLRVSG